MLQEYLLVIWLLAAAVGAAMALGTGAALYHLRRTGEVPGTPPDREDGVVAPVPDVRMLRRRTAIGVVIAVAGLVGAGSVLG